MTFVHPNLPALTALTVSPTFKTKYSEEAPNTTPKIVPTMSGTSVSSGKFAEAGMYGLNACPGCSGGASGGGVACGVSDDISVALTRFGLARVADSACALSAREIAALCWAQAGLSKTC